jgi:hypothetical protein
MSKKIDYVKDEKIQFLKEILRNFDSFEIGKKYVYKYNSHVRDFEYELHKLNPQTIYMYIFDNKIEIMKKNENKFEVIINLDDYLSIAKMRRITIFLKYESKNYHNYLVWYYRGTWHLVFNDLVIPIRYDSRLLKLIIVKKPQRFYLSLPELTKKELPDSEFGFPIIKNELYLYSINGKKVKDLIEHYQRKYKGMPYIIRIKLQNRKIEYAIFKMLIKKGIFRYINGISRKQPYRIRKCEQKSYEWEFSNIILPVPERMKGGQFPNFIHTAIQDYDYDSTNQVLIKVVDKRNQTFLCGVDYANNMWCMRLSGFMYRYRIKSVYKVLYDLDEQTKMFEF